MARKDKPRAEHHRAPKHTHEEEMEERRRERREKKHAFDVLRKHVKRTGHAPPAAHEQ